jgi:hypothetical protein
MSDWDEVDYSSDGASDRSDVRGDANHPPLLGVADFLSDDASASDDDLVRAPDTTDTATSVTATDTASASGDSGAVAAVESNAAAAKTSINNSSTKTLTLQPPRADSGHPSNQLLLPATRTKVAEKKLDCRNNGRA